MRYIKMKDVIATLIIRIILSIVLISSFSGLAMAQTEPVFVQKDFQPTFQNAIPLNISNTGAATYNIPIIVPPGRGGIAMPNLSLTYNSQQKNGWVGVGWDLEVGSIQRSTKKGLDYNGFDFVVDGSLELVPRSDWGSSGYYGAKIEGGFTKYKFNGATVGWEATARDGTTYSYGTTAASRQDNAKGVFKWCLDSVEDTNGNTVTITYTKDQGAIYPARIDYTGSKNYVKFITDNNRTDASPQYGTLASVVMAKRLKTIEVYGNGQLARKYELTYEQGTSSKRSRLTKVQVYGSNGSTALPPMTFGWQEGNDGHFGTIQSSFVKPTSCFFRFADINGDGRDDLVMINGLDVYAYLSQGNTFGSGVHTTLSPGSSGTPYMFDVDGDGMADVVIEAAANVYTYHSNGNGSFVTTPIRSQLAVGSGMGSLHIGDVDGDGLADIIGLENNSDTIWTHFSKGDGTFASGIVAYLNGLGSHLTISLGDVNGDGRADIVMTPTNNDLRFFTYLSNGDGTFSDGIQQNTDVQTYTPQLADINGDGLMDYTRRYYAKLYMCLSKGDGTYNTCIIKDSLSENISFADINGDGCTDLVGYLANANVNVYLGNCDGTFRDPIQTNLGSNGPSFFFADVNGDGLSDIVGLYTSGSNLSGYTNLAAGAPADLLTKIENGLGATITISYEPSTQYDNTLLPFVVNTVSSITVDDGINDVIPQTSYTYAGGYYDYNTRDFWGFSQMIQTNPGPDGNADGTTVTSWFYQDQFRKGRAYEVDFQNPNGKFLTKQILTWQTYSSTNPPTWAFVKLAQQHTDFYDNNKITAHAQEDYTYNNTYGYWLTKKVSGTGAEDITAEHEYTKKGTWLWRLSQETITGETSGKVRETTYGYDSSGNMTSKALWLNTGGNPTFSMTYDGYGNQKTLTDARWNMTSIDYDTSTNTYPARITYPQTEDGHTHIVEYQYDYRFGTVKSKKDERHYTTSNTYDVFGRLKQVDFPDGGQQTITYNDTASPRYTLTEVKESSGTVDTYQYFDGLDRKIRIVTYGENGAEIDSTIHYDYLGRVDRTEGPYFLSGARSYVQTTYDYRNRPTQVTTPAGTTTYSYSGLATTITDPDSKSKTETRDYLNRIIQVADSGGTTTYNYNAAGDLLRISAPLGNTIIMTYDTLGRKTAMDDPDLGSWAYTYDANGNLLSEANERTVASLALEASEIDNTYDEMNRVISETKIIDGAPVAYTTQYEYDLAGKPTKQTYPDNYKVTYAYYPGSGLLYTVTGSDSEVFATCSDYEPTGQMGQIDHYNDTATRYSYNRQTTRLTGIVTADPTGKPANDIQNRAYAYSPAGDITKIIDNARGITYNYQYDSLHRLTTETSGGVYPQISYAYNGVGNITQKKVGADTYVYNSYDTAHKHAVKTITLNGTAYNYAYDEAGNMISGPDFTDPADIATRAMAYYADNLPATIQNTAGGITDFAYDGLGNRVRKQAEGGSTTYYIGDHFEVKDGVPTKYIFAGNLRVAKVTPRGRYYYHKDHLSSSSAITDSSGAVIEMTEYRPFGDERDHAGDVVSDYKFTDQELDTETGLYNYDARHYDPVIGRFISADSMVQDYYDPQMLNRYSYTRNNPLIYVDPDGKLLMAVEYNSGKQFGSYIISIKNGAIKIFPARTRADDKYNKSPVASGEYSAHFGEHKGQYPAMRIVQKDTAKSTAEETIENRTLSNEAGGTRQYINIHRGDRVRPDINGQVQETGSGSCFVIPWSKNLTDKWNPNDITSWGPYYDFIKQYGKKDIDESIIVNRSLDKLRKAYENIKDILSKDKEKKKEKE